MFSYMTELEKVEIEEGKTVEIDVQGHDLESLLYTFLDEFLYNFCTEFIVCKQIEITKFDLENFSIAAVGRGEKFSIQKHSQGTEIKAITYSNMQIHQNPGKCEVYVIVDI